MKKFKCRICGYIHEIEELPDDFKCPICGVGVELFDEILRPYYEKNGGTYDFSQCGVMQIMDDYIADKDSYNYITFYNQSDYNLTQQLVNEYLSQKEANKQL